MRNLKWKIFGVFCLMLLSLGYLSHHKSQSSLKKVLLQTVHLNIGCEPGTLDPRKARSLADLNIIKMFMEGLTRVTFNSDPDFALAKNITSSENKMIYTITLKEANWSNGDPIIAEDFMYSWEKTLTPSFPSDSASILYVIKNAEKIKTGILPVSSLGVQAPDEKTLIIELEKPTPYFLELLASPTFFPIHAKTDKENPHWAETPETYVSSGPFKPIDWKHSNVLTAVKNENYWDAKVVHLKKIEMVMVSSETGFNMYQNKELEWEGSPFSVIPLDALSTLRKNQELQSQSFLITSFLRTNTGKAPFNSPNVRKAFAVAMKRQEIIDHVLFGNSFYASGLVPTCLNLKDKEYFHDGDLELANSLLRKAIDDHEIQEEDLSSITLSFLSSEKNYRICQAIQQQWKEAFNITVQLEPVEGKVYFSRVSNKDYQLSLGSWVADFRDPISFLEVFRTKDIGTNNTDWENNDYLTSLDKSYKATDPEERKAILQSCEKILVDEMPIIPVCHGSMNYVRNEELKNVMLSDTGTIDFKWAFLDKQETTKARL